MTLQMLNELKSIGDLPIYRTQVAAAAGGVNPLPLIPGTEEFADPWLVDWHRHPPKWTNCDVACYSIFDCTVSGDGNIWVGEQLITSPEVMPPYVAKELAIASGGNEHLRRQSDLPIREIKRPCLVAVGHGIRVYGHFLIEMLFRILVAQKLLRGRYGVLLDQAALKWLLYILENDLGISPSDFEFFDPTRERIWLRPAFVPGRVFIGERVHPYANVLLDELVRRLEIRSSTLRRAFITRRRYSNPAAPYRICTNEADLVAIARNRGFEPVVVEEMSWREQISLFRDAEIIVGQAGSGLHTALFSTEGSRLASIGFMNPVQSQIAALRGQEMAYFAKGLKLADEFRVDEGSFSRFLDAVCIAK